MKRAIGFLLILAFCLSLACPVFAAAPSPGENGPIQQPPFWGEIPKTGDVILFWVLILTASLLALGAVYFIYRKRFSK